MRRAIIVLVGSLAACSGAALNVWVPPAALLDSTDSIDAIAADYWEILLAESPVWATQIGDRRFDAMLPDLSPEVREATQHRKQELQVRLDGINAGFLTGEALLTARFLATLLSHDLGRYVCQRDLWNIDQLSGYHLLVAQLPEIQPLDSSAAVTSYMTRLGHVAGLFEQHIANLGTGLGLKYSAPRPVVRRVIAQLRHMERQPPSQSPYVLALQRASQLDADERAAARDDVLAMVRQTIAPALRDYRRYLEETYAPRARDDVAITANPAGAACYAALVAEYAGDTDSPAVLQELGQQELGRLQSALASLAEAAGQPQARAYAQALTAAPQGFLPNAAALLQHHRDAVARAQAALPQAFTAAAAPALDVCAIEAWRERDAPAGYYQPAPVDGSRPARYYVNTYRPQRRPLFTMDALAFHETFPGHHLQVTAAQALTGLPAVRRFAGPATFVEGWAVYSERLADDLKLYSDPPSRFGMLNYQAWRAARLVVDTGLHASGWTRDQAVAFLRDNLFLTADEIDNEVDRLINWPGQALAYASGGMVFAELRALAERQQGERFDLKALHAQLLRHGALPLPVLRDTVSTWLLQEAPRRALADVR